MKLFEFFAASSRIALLQAQIADLQKRLNASEKERRALTDRLLEKHNVAPLAPEAPRPEVRTVEVLSPYGVVPPEMEDAVRASWVKEETEYIQMTEGLDEERARLLAERRFTEQHRAIH